MSARPHMPSVPAAGHITDRGFWHPGPIPTCNKCSPAPDVARCVECQRPVSHPDDDLCRACAEKGRR